MHSNVTSKNVSWLHFSWPILYITMNYFIGDELFFNIWSITILNTIQYNNGYREFA